MIIEDTYPALAVRAEELQSRGRRFKYQLHLLDGNLLRWKLKEKGQRTYENLQNNNLNISFFKKIIYLKTVVSVRREGDVTRAAHVAHLVLLEKLSFGRSCKVKQLAAVCNVKNRDSFMEGK